MTDVFQLARNRITRSLIESYFPGGKWSNGDYLIRSPLRVDKNPSFNISEDGVYYDFATAETGDFITLISKVKNITPLESAQMIAGENSTPVKIKTEHKQKIQIEYKPIDPTDEKTIQGLKDYYNSSYFLDKFGTPDTAYAIKKNNKIEFVICRYHYDSENNHKPKKNLVPFYLGVDGKFHASMPYKGNVPLYKNELMTANKKIIIHEGEQKALKCNLASDKYVHVSWVGGVNRILDADFSQIENHPDVIFFPDNDTPGMEAALKLKNKYPHIKIIEHKEKPEKWDAVDLLNEGGNIDEYIDNASYVPEPEQLIEPSEIDETKTVQTDPLQDNKYYKVLGYDEDGYYFFHKETKTIINIKRGSFTSSKIISLAILPFFQAVGLTSDKSGHLILDSCQDHLQRIAHSIGRFRPEKIRGVGVWRDESKFVVNTGDGLIVDTIYMSYGEFDSDYVYISESLQFSALDSKEIATDEEGIKLVSLFNSQKWKDEKSKFAVLGWCLMSNFAGCLPWRPHITISAKYKSGKSWLIENLIMPIVGDFAYQSSGSDTEPGLRRQVNNRTRPVILDEFKENKRNENNIHAIIQLANNASTDSSSAKSMASKSGGIDKFVVRSPFCFIADTLPELDKSMDTRTIKCELQSPLAGNEKEFIQEKMKDTKLFFDVMKKPAKFRNRIFDRLKEFVHDAEELKSELVTYFGDKRHADNWSPIFSAIFHIKEESRNMYIGSDLTDDGKIFLAEMFAMIPPIIDNEVNADEDDLITTVLDSKIRLEIGEDVTIAEAMQLYESRQVAKEELIRIGIKISKGSLYISSNSQAIKTILKNKAYANTYDNQLSRNDICENKDEAKRILFTRKQKARKFNLQKFKEKYIGTEVDDE